VVVVVVRGQMLRRALPFVAVAVAIVTCHKAAVVVMMVVVRRKMMIHTRTRFLSPILGPE